jgi:organic hydroperoxide reductase OsmC/OhrA
MSEHVVTVSWRRETPDFTYDTYKRDHRWEFGSGSLVHASAAPEFRGNPDLVDPEEALVAALSSCHMLTFLAIASRKRYVVDSYTDAAVGYLEKNANGKLAVTRVTLRPRVTFSGDRQPAAADIDRMHHTAHEECFIANSVTTQITVEPVAV